MGHYLSGKGTGTETGIGLQVNDFFEEQFEQQGRYDNNARPGGNKGSRIIPQYQERDFEKVIQRRNGQEQKR